MQKQHIDFLTIPTLPKAGLCDAPFLVVPDPGARFDLLDFFGLPALTTNSNSMAEPGEYQGALSRYSSTTEALHG